VVAARTLNKNAAKPDIVRLLFGVFIKSNRTTNGRQSGKVRNWLHGHIKRLSFHAEKDPEEQRYEALYELFQRCLRSHQEKSKIISHFITFNKFTYRAD
jgi:hypothetical protein